MSCKKQYASVALLVFALLASGLLLTGGCRKKKKGHHKEQQQAAALIFSGNGSWTEIDSGINCPAEGRYSQTAVWTGNRMLIWGGVQFLHPNGYLVINDGGVYDAPTDQWEQIIDMPGFALGAYMHTSVWASSEMIAWGGQFFNASATNGSEVLKLTNSGGIYNPDNNTWRQASTTGLCPSARENHTAVWTGNSMIIWGGDDLYNSLNTGGIYFPGNDSWIPTSTGGACPNGRNFHTAVWTGSKMIIWGGRFAGFGNKGTGAIYDPQADMWTTTSTDGDCPSARSYHTAVWTGTHMIIWGGVCENGAYTNTGAMYHPGTDTWVPLPVNLFCPSPRQWHTAVWTGTTMIIWGGVYYKYFPWSGSIYDPGTDKWTPVYSGPSTPYGTQHSAIWTGSEMIIWGSGGNKGYRFTP